MISVKLNVPDASAVAVNSAVASIISAVCIAWAPAVVPAVARVSAAVGVPFCCWRPLLFQLSLSCRACC
jgi:hypothetical protein